MSLAEALAEAAADLPGAEAQEAGGGIDWLVDGRPFAAVRGGIAEFRLSAAVGAASLGTPDATRSQRGPEWVAFSPPELDQYSLDRATAWLASAHRQAISGGR